MKWFIPFAISMLIAGTASGSGWYQKGDYWYKNGYNQAYKKEVIGWDCYGKPNRWRYVPVRVRYETRYRYEQVKAPEPAQDSYFRNTDDWQGPILDILEERVKFSQQAQAAAIKHAAMMEVLKAANLDDLAMPQTSWPMNPYHMPWVANGIQAMNNVQYPQQTQAYAQQGNTVWTMSMKELMSQTGGSVDAAIGMQRAADLIGDAQKYTNGSLTQYQNIVGDQMEGQQEQAMAMKEALKIMMEGAAEGQLWKARAEALEKMITPKTDVERETVITEVRPDSPPGEQVVHRASSGPVQTVINERCLKCHSPGGSAPEGLNFTDWSAVPIEIKGKSIAEIRDRTMPKNPDGSTPGPALSINEIAILANDFLESQKGG